MEKKPPNLPNFIENRLVVAKGEGLGEDGVGG